MLHQNLIEPFALADVLEDGFCVPRQRRNVGDILDALISLTGASDACIFDVERHLLDEREFPAACKSPSALSRLDHSATALRRDIARMLSHEPADGTALWLSDFRDVLCLPFAIDAEWTACVALSYPGHLSSAERGDAERRATMVAPLVKSHLRMAEELVAATRRFDGAMGFLDANHVGTILFDNQGRMILANSAAHDMLNAQDGMRLGRSGPMPVSLKDATRFQLALEHQIAQNGDDRKAPCPNIVLLIHRARGRRPFVATLVPMAAPANRKGEPAVMLYLFDPLIEQLDHLDAVCELYGLSRVEARLVHHIVAGKTIEEAAIAMRIKSPTARTYLKHIFMKTGTHRQIELVRLLMLSTGRIASQAIPEALN